MSKPQFQLEQAFRRAILAAFGFEADPIITVAQNEKFGDYQSNAAMGLAKQVAERTGQKTNPRQVAEQIRQKLELGDMAQETTIAGPGFINIRLAPVWMAGQLQAIAANDRLGIDPVGQPQTVVVDYSGPNIAKEMHVAHLRGTIIGDALARVLEFAGHRVIRQNHVGDWGLQMGMVTYAVENLMGETDAQALDLRKLEQMYRVVNRDAENPEVRKPLIERTRILQQTPRSELKTWQRVRQLTLASVQRLYQQLDVTLTPTDVRGESDYSEEYAVMIEELKRSGVAIETEGAIGIFPPGFVNREGEPRPFVIQSKDGTYQYPTFDLAALRYRVLQLHADWIIYTHDARQAEHFAMLFAVAGMLGLTRAGDRSVRLDYAPFGAVLGEDGKPIKSRSGENIKLADLLAEAEQRAMKIVSEKNAALPEEQRRKIAHCVGVGAVKYGDLSKDRISDYIFSWEKVLSFEGNTAPYLQNAYVRVKGIFRKAAAGGAEPRIDPTALRLESSFELALARHILRLSEMLDLVLRELKPHYLCMYLYELATRFHAFFENCPVIQSPEPMRSSRLALCDLTARTMAQGLDLLGIEHPDRM